MKQVKSKTKSNTSNTTQETCKFSLTYNPLIASNCPAFSPQPHFSACACLWLFAISASIMMASSNGNIFHLTVRGIHQSPVNSPHKGHWRQVLMFSLIWAWINGWVNDHEAGGLRRHRAHYDVTVICGFESIHDSSAKVNYAIGTKSLLMHSVRAHFNVPGSSWVCLCWLMGMNCRKTNTILSQLVNDCIRRNFHSRFYCKWPHLNFHQYISFCAKQRNTVDKTMFVQALRRESDGSWS